MASSLKEQLAKDPSLVSVTDERGWTFLHQEALAGSTATVKVLLAAGADPSAVTDHGMTPLQLAQSLGWDKIVALLANR
jgi:ankyrin repeat protein